MRLKLQVKLSRMIVDAVIVMLTVVFLCINTTHETAVMTGCLIMALNITALIRGRKNWYTLVMSGFILWSNYSICAVNLFFPIDNFFTEWKKEPVMIVCMSIILIFSAIFALGMPSVKKSAGFYEKGMTDNPVIVIVAALALILIGVFGYARPSAIGERGEYSTLYEYAVIIFIIAFFYAGNKLSRLLLSILLFMFAAQDLLFSGRVTALQLIICWFLIFFAHKAKVRYILPVAVVLMILLVGIGNMRINYDFGKNVFENAINGLVYSRFSFDTAYSAFYTSVTYILTEARVTMAERLIIFGKFVLSIFGGEAVKGGDLAEYTLKYYMHYNGGILPIYLHFYLGYFGVVLSGAYTAFLTRKTVSDKPHTKWRNYLKCLGVYVACTVPRWYLYSPTPLFRGILILSLVYAVCLGFNKLSMTFSRGASIGR